ncbi:hypothetical protein PTSG_10547 [Salpingoeca rosetta]|uniref:Uncharacterized protein n=1 Tax=Salpingoeca rosetta (strain ATCC 50818 / BSB-021) TaxID=946362 RepID=F2URN6_SALR5|nr:uncharacterized protein PTSG_10547 [Salpingoeca rosetta]EGD80291.1 hypothetical protein PTSG_10547 [Salpingoeca rosetta]|eukprot:XP_004988081.1 hypothetical protein PTSG_10547 [Salpingoeca rosetta]
MNPKHADVQRRFSVAHDKTSRRYSVAISAASARPSRLGLNVVGRSGTGSVTGTRGGAHLRSSNSSNLISARNIDKGTPGSAGNTGRQHPRNRNMRQERVSTASSAASLSPLSKPRSGSQRSRPTRRLTNKATFRRRLPGWKGYQARKNAELAQAVKVGDIERAKRLLREGADINATERGNHNRSLVHASVQFLQDDHQLCSEVVDELADLGADCTCVDDIGNSPLHLACSLGNLPAAEVLLNQNLSPVQTNKQGSTPLQLAVENGNASMVRLLLTHQGSQSAVRTLFTTPQDHMHTRMRSDVYRSALDSNATAVLAELVQFHTRVGGVSFDDIATPTLELASLS